MRADPRRYVPLPIRHEGVSSRHRGCGVREPLRPRLSTARGLVRVNIVDCRAETHNHVLLHCDCKMVARIAKEVRAVFNIDRIIEYIWGDPYEKRRVPAM